MSIEELVKKYIKRNGWSFSHDGECADAIRAALTEQAAAYEQRIRELEAQRVPEGWKLVPVEPTDEMIDAGCDEADAYRVDIDRAYRAMLSVSPEVGNHD